MLANLFPPALFIGLALVAFAISIVGMFIFVRRLMRRAWQPMVDAFPPRPAGPGAVRKVAQSFGCAQLRVGGAAVITADQDYLHIEGWGPFKWASVSRVSIPWSDITVSESRLGRAVAIQGQPATLPEWCLEIAVGRAERAVSP